MFWYDLLPCSSVCITRCYIKVIPARTNNLSLHGLAAKHDILFNPLFRSCPDANTNSRAGIDLATSFDLSAKGLSRNSRFPKDSCIHEPGLLLRNLTSGQMFTTDRHNSTTCHRPELYAAGEIVRCSHAFTSAKSLKHCTWLHISTIGCAFH